MKAKNYTSKLSLALLFSLLTFQFLNAQSAILTPEGGVKANKLHDTENNTRVEVEKTPNDGKIRFYIKGEEIGVLDSNRFELIFPGQNLFIGEKAGYASDAASYGAINNIGIGYYSLKRNLSGEENTAVGINSLQNNLFQDENSAFGFNALKENNGGFNNSAFGANSQEQNLAGAANASLGSYSLYSNLSGSLNSAFGSNSLENLEFGHGNVAIGHSSGKLDTLSNYNVYIGYSSGSYPNNATKRFAREGSVFIGTTSGSNEFRSNRLYIENSNSQNPLIYGNFEDDSLKVNGNLEVAENLKTSGFTQLGNESPAIKLKTILDTSPTVMGVSKSIAHGLSASQIINVSIYINNSVQNWIPPNYDGGPNYEYDYYFNHSSIIIKTVAGNSANVIDKPMKILITYTE